MRKDIKQTMKIEKQTKRQNNIRQQQNSMMENQVNSTKKQIFMQINVNEKKYQQLKMHIYQPGLFISSVSSLSQFEQQKTLNHNQLNLIRNNFQSLQFNNYHEQINLLLSNSIGFKTQTKQQNSLISSKTYKYLKCLIDNKKDSASKSYKYYQGASGISSVSRNNRSSNSQKYQFLIDSNNSSTYQQIEQDFTHKQKQSLKNAFRYICRLVFKQSSKYQNKINQIAHKLNELGISNQSGINDKANGSGISDKQNELKVNDYKKVSLKRLQSNRCRLYLFKNAQLISGERHFKQHLSNLSAIQSLITLHYMVWFLKHKYLRYINKSNNQNKGKRKDMKKELYLRFKNQVMIGYLNTQIEAISK